MTVNEMTGTIIGAGVEVHRALGPGLLETAYVQCLCRELHMRGLEFVREQSVPVIYKGLKIDCGYRADIVVAGIVVLEIKSVEAILPVHEAQLLTYLRLGGWKAGLLMNFNVPILTDGGIRRKVLGLEE
jgi:GxxExxY protein